MEQEKTSSEFKIFTNTNLKFDFKNRIRILVLGEMRVTQHIWLDSPAQPEKAETRTEVKKIFWRIIKWYYERKAAKSESTDSNKA